MKRSLWLELLLVAAIFFVSNLNSALRQKQNTHNGGTAWETPYFRVAQQFILHQRLEAEAPYIFRLGTPWLVSRVYTRDSWQPVRVAQVAALALTTATQQPYLYHAGAPPLASFVSPPDLFRAFRIVNITGSAIACVLLLFWLRGYVQDWKIRVVLITLFLIQWDAPARLLYHTPVHVDAWLFVFVLAGLLILRTYVTRPSTGSLLGLTGVSMVGAYFRDATLFVPLAAVAARPLFVKDVAQHWQWRLPAWQNCIPFICGFLAFMSIRLVGHQTDHYSFWEQIYRFLYDKPVLSYIHSWFLAFGPVLFILLFDWRNARDFLLQEQWLALFLVAGMGFGFVGGTDTERLQYWSMPCVYVLLGRAVERHRSVLASWPLITFVTIGQILSSRILWTTPDYPTNFTHTFPLLQQFGSNVQMLDLFSFHGYRPKETLSLMQYLIFGTIVLYWMSRRSGKHSESTSATAASASL